MTFGVQSVVDPADAMFTAANFPGASSTVLNNARSLYGYLTGRVNGDQRERRSRTRAAHITYLGTHRRPASSR